MPAALEVIVLAAGLLAFFALGGWGLLRWLAPDLPVDATLALAPAVGVAAFSAVSAFVVLRLPTWLALAVAAGLPLALVVRAVRGLRARPRQARARLWLALGAVVAVAVLAASLPALVHGGGTPATWGNADPYLWVSQAKSLLDGPPPGPPTLFPDRLAYDNLTSGGWAPGLPALTALAAGVAREDPVEVFGAVAALLYALTPLVTFALARLALAWSSRLSVTAAAVVALSPYRLFAAYYGWQPQLAGVASLLAGALFLRLALAGGPAARRLALLAALMVAGALGMYRLPFLPYVVFASGLVAAGYAIARRGMVRKVAHHVALFAGAVFVLALPSLVAFGEHASSFWRGEDDSAAWTDYVRGLPSDALGLLPRAPNLTRQPPDALKLLALTLSLLMLASGLRALRRKRTGYGDVVAALCIGSLAALLVAQLPVFTPYFSIKLAAYGAVPIILTALAPLEGRRLPPRKLVVGGLLALLSATVVALSGRATLSASASAALSTKAAALPASEAFTIRFRTSWKQMWALYFTRDHAVDVLHPSDYLTTLGSASRSQNIEGRP